MKKKIGIFGMILAIFVLFSLSVSAAGMLSPAIGVLQEDHMVVKTGVGKNTVSFAGEDFEKYFEGNDVKGIVITSLPALSDGVLKLGALDVAKGQIIAGDAISALRFVPADENKTATFSFLPYGSSYEKDFVCTVYMLDSLNFAPESASHSLSTLENIPVYAAVSAEDPDGDMLTYEVVTWPTEGTLDFSSDGSYCYTPNVGKTGEDRFSYVAIDPYGNRSEVSEVKISTAKSTRNGVYSDMKTGQNALSAAVLAEKGAFIGEKVGSSWYFHPDLTVTRGEFLMMAMKMNDIEPALFAQNESGFADSASFSEAENEYITAAVKLGIVCGMDTEEGRCYKPDEVITSAQASTIISRIAGLRGLSFAGAVLVSAEAEVSDEGMAMLQEVGLAVEGERDHELTRADAAGLLYQFSLKTEKN